MKHSGLVAAFVVGLFAAGPGCGGDDQISATTGAGTTSGTTGSGGGGTGGGGAGGTGGTGGTGGAGGGGTSAAGASCFKDPPPGAALAPPPPAYSGGACPALADGMNTLLSAGNERTFRLVLPPNLQPDERPPVIFLWHWLGGSADDFYTKGDVQAAVDLQRFIAVIPESKGDLTFKWPFDVSTSDARMQEELTFFDDMLACVSEQLQVNKECVSSAGVSAGALFTDQLAGQRGEYLSSILSLSGGVDGFIKEWTPPEHKMPAMVLWGGPDDTCIVINFEETSHALEASLEEGGHFYLECIHNCGHAEPPIDVPAGTPRYAPLWQFVFDHPYWLEAGDSPYLSPDGIPSELPTWCGIGAGSSTPRTGECPSGSGC